MDLCQCGLLYNTTVTFQHSVQHWKIKMDLGTCTAIVHTRTHVMHKRHTDNMYMQFSRSLRIMIIWVNEDLVTCTGVHTEHIYHLQQGESINKQQQHLL